MSESSWVQFPYFEQESDSERANRLGVEQLAEPRVWLNETQLGIVFEPLNLRRAIPAELINEGKRNNWIGAFHYVREQTVASMDYKMPPELVTTGFSLQLKEHDYMWDEQSVGGKAREAVLMQKAAGDETAQPVVALLIKDKDPSAQRLVIRDEQGWREPTEEDTDRVGSYLYITHYLAIVAANEAAVDNRGETS